MREIKVREATLDDADIPARYGVDRDLLRVGIGNSHKAWVCTVDGEVMAVWGIAMPVLTDPAVLWAATTNVVERNKLAFIKTFRDFIWRAGDAYGPLVGWLTPGAPSRWLELAGFEIEPPGEDGMRRFVRWL